MPPKRLTPEDVRQMIADLPGAVEGAHMGHADFRIKNKIFASLSPDEHQANAKISPANLDLLVQQDPETFRDVWGGRWVGIRLDRVTRPVLRGLLADAYEMTVPTPPKRPSRTKRPPPRLSPKTKRKTS